MVELYHKVRRCIGASFKGRRILMISKTVKENLIIFAGIALLCSDLIGSISLYLTSIVFCTDYMVITSYENLVGWKIINTLLLYILILVINDMTNRDPLLKTVKMNRLPVYHIFLGILAGPFLIWIATVLKYYLGKIIVDDYFTELECFIHGVKGMPKPGFFNILIFSMFAAFSEELLRFFVYENIKKIFSRTFTVIIIILYSVYFGFDHTYQGLLGVVSAVFMSIFMFSLYIWKRNFFIPFIAHFVYDCMALFLSSWVAKG